MPLPDLRTLNGEELSALHSQALIAYSDARADLYEIIHEMERRQNEDDGAEVTDARTAHL